MKITVKILILIFLFIIFSCKEKKARSHSVVVNDSSFVGNDTSKIVLMKDYQLGCGSLHAFPHGTEYYEYQIKSLTEDEVIIFTKNNLPVIRCYAFIELYKRNSPKVFEVLKHMINDTSIVLNDYGCGCTITTVGRYCFFIAAFGHDDFEGKSLNKAEYLVIDSLFKLDSVNFNASIKRHINRK